MTTFLPAGRRDVGDLFRLSGILESTRLDHTPYLVFVTTNDTVAAHIVKSTVLLLAYPDPTPVMVQWQGLTRSDFFHTTVGEVRAACAEWLG